MTKTAPAEVPGAGGLRVAVLHSSFNAPVVQGLLDGALVALREMGARPDAVVVEAVPGAFELPLAAQAAGRSGRFDAVVALGAVIRGHTDHYDHIAREASAGLAAVARETGVPVGFGVLTCHTEAQALARSAPGADNKGAEAARAAIALVHTLRRLTDNGATEARRHGGKKTGRKTKRGRRG
jgi:6,7-dimethyl-8-ribityllumazine synthase